MVEKSIKCLIREYKEATACFLASKDEFCSNAWVVCAKNALLIMFQSRIVQAIQEYNCNNYRYCLVVDSDVSCSPDGEVTFVTTVYLNIEEHDVYEVFVSEVALVIMLEMLDKKDPFEKVEFKIKIKK